MAGCARTDWRGGARVSGSADDGDRHARERGANRLERNREMAARSGKHAARFEATVWTAAIGEWR
ncbi:hypothetical protein [Marinitenerispora sediminis]|uniref:Uncharacterized protein n=1 Tax=Marinitenerispora sediminis TaxID=1931232 RepID=A0A368TBV7_9ACTN|nr:hypothetical protein [Marinitenerispora sediminis]RCV55270.1 hypothetical protein DEF28_06290 [Marinitenerispora sediminis]RCV61626.1 hypothetical protein DEF23_01570 [Marinitenerispora sediminis]RCV62644.1 hypothetical protein DEF24_00220 [Marinitenerispora sediminis]